MASDEYFEGKLISIKETDYNQMCDMLNKFAVIVEAQKKVINNLNNKLSTTDVSLDIASKLKKYQDILNMK